MEDPIKASLLTLPEELLRHLIRMVKRQDRKTSLRTSNNIIGVHCQGVSSMHSGLYLEMPINGLSALSRTCRQLRDLCCPLLFSSITSKQFFRPTFRRRIALLYSNHIRTLTISPVKGHAELEDTIYLASSLQNLAKLKIHVDAFELPIKARDLDGSFRHELNAEYLAVLGGVLARIKTLELTGFDCVESIVAILSRSPNLVSLRLHSFLPPVVPDDEIAAHAVELSQALQGLEKLSTLQLFESEAFLEILSDGHQINASTLRLGLKAFLYRTKEDGNFEAARQFLDLVAPSLRKFTLLLEEDQPIDASHLLIRRPFPELRTLCIGGDLTDFEPLRSLDGNNTSLSTDYPKLRLLEIRSRFEEVPHLRLPHPSHLHPHFPSLHTLYYNLQPSQSSHFPGIPLKDLRDYQQYCHENGTTLRGLKWDPFMQHRSETRMFGEAEEEVGKESYLDTRGEEIQRILDFARRIKDRARITLDTSAMNRLLDYLDPIKLLEELELD